jgi:hypothetical protein
MTPPVFPAMKALEIEDRDVVREYYRRFPAESSESCFGNHFIWRHYDRPKITTIKGNLCLYFSPPGEPAYFLPPVGENDIPATLAACLDFAPRLSRVPAAFARKHCATLRIEPDRNEFDYVYAASDLIELRGKKFDGKRNRIRKFEREHSWRYTSLTQVCLPGCRDLFEEWLSDQGAPTLMSAAQGDAIREALSHYEELGLSGGAIEIDGRIAAISIGEPLTRDTAVIHIEIVSPCCEGLAQLMNREFVKNAWASFAFVNRESDLGIPGLRKAKMSYQPHHLVEKYHVHR